jgi:D-alanine transaminase
VPDVGFVNGRFMPLAQATVPVEDRGYQFGDGVYEVVRTYHGRPFHLEAHLARLERSAEAIGVSVPYPREEWERLVTEGLRQAGYAHSKIYVQLTRGVAPRDHLFPADAQPAVVMTIRELHPLSEALRQTGVEAMTTDDLRWGRCDIKSLNLLPNVMARQRAKEAGAFEAIFVRNGVVTEGSVSNVMVVREGRLCTAPEGPGILSGVTRKLVLDLARKEGLAVEERAVTIEELRRADEVLLTGTTVEVLAVVRVDQQPVGAGIPGPVTRQLDRWFQLATG